MGGGDPQAGLVRDRMLAGAANLRADVDDAGGVWHDRPVLVCRASPNVLVTGRDPRASVEMYRKRAMPWRRRFDRIS